MKMNEFTIAMLILIGLSAGFLSGMVGVGGGIVMVPMLVFVLGVAQHTAQGTSLAVLMVPVSAVSVYQYWKAGQVEFKYAFVIALFFVAGSYLGAKLSLKIEPHIIKKVFGVFMILVALKFIFSK